MANKKAPLIHILNILKLDITLVDVIKELSQEMAKQLRGCLPSFSVYLYL